MPGGEAVARAPLTVSAVEQDLNTLSQRVDVLRFPNERVPLFCWGGGSRRRRRRSCQCFSGNQTFEIRQSFLFFFRRRTKDRKNNLLSIDLGNESDLLMGLLLTSEQLSR